MTSTVNGSVMNEIDRWTQTINGVNYIVRIVPDYDAEPTDFDFYTQREIDAWRNDKWSYVGVLVSPDIPGLDQEWFDASLWGIEYGDLPLFDVNGEATGKVLDATAYIRDDVVPQLAEEVWHSAALLAGLRDTLNSILWNI
jgi:hypothetical protein